MRVFFLTLPQIRLYSLFLVWLTLMMPQWTPNSEETVISHFQGLTTRKKQLSRTGNNAIVA